MPARLLHISVPQFCESLRFRSCSLGVWFRFGIAEQVLKSSSFYSLTLDTGMHNLIVLSPPGVSACSVGRFLKPPLMDMYTRNAMASRCFEFERRTSKTPELYQLSIAWRSPISSRARCSHLESCLRNLRRERPMLSTRVTL